MVRWTRLAGLAALATVLGCASTPTNGSQPRRDPSVITAEELSASTYSDLHSAVRGLRPRWLVVRGPKSTRGEEPLVVYQDRERLGGIESLRFVEIGSVVEIRYLTAIQAQQQFGLGHTGGAIVVITR